MELEQQAESPIISTYRTSPKMDKFWPAWLSFQSKLKPAKKDSKNPAFGSSYADIAAVLSVVMPPLNESGMVLFQPPSTTDSGRSVGVTTLVTHAESGQYLEWDISMSVPQIQAGGKTSYVQEIGKLITYLKRYALMSGVGLATEDDDGNGTAGQQPADRRSGAYQGSAEQPQAAKKEPPRPQKVNQPETPAQPKSSTSTDSIASEPGVEELVSLIINSHYKDKDKVLRDYLAKHIFKPENREAGLTHEDLLGFLQAWANNSDVSTIASYANGAAGKPTLVKGIKQMLAHEGGFPGWVKEMKAGK